MSFFFLLLLFSYRRIFGFVHIKNNKTKATNACPTCISDSTAFRWLTQLKLPLYYLMCLGVFFLLGWHMYSSEVWFDVNCLFVSFFSFSFFLGLLAGHAKNYTNPSISFFFWSSPSLNCNYFIFDFILVCLILLVFFLSNLVLIFLIVFFLFSIIFLIYLFFFNFILEHFFSLKFNVKFGANSFNCYF